MSATFSLFMRLIARPLAHEPVRTSLTVLAVALGVSVVIAIDLAGQAAAGSFNASLESLSGESDLLITGMPSLDEHLLGTLVQLPYNFEWTPRIEDFATLNGKGEALPFIGLDLIGSDQMRALATPQAARLAPSGEDDRIWVGSALKLHAGERVQLLINDAMSAFTVAGVLPSLPARAGESNVILADIALAQRVTRKIGKLDSIAIRLPSGKSLSYWREFLRKNVPSTVSIEPQGARTEDNRKMLSAFRSNLRVLSYIALVVGAFLIYNTISVSVVRRRNEIGVLRALGATRSLILTGFLAEASFFAVCGSVLGLFLGPFFAIAAVRLIGSTVQALYVSSRPAPIEISLAGAATGMALGFATSILAALGPALEASQVAPVEAMARGRQEYLATERSRHGAVLAAALFATSAALALLPAVHGQPLFAYGAVVLLIAGTALVIPALLRVFVQFTQRFIERFLSVEILLAARSMRSSLARMSVLTAALATAVAMMVSVGIMVGSFRETVFVWMNNQLKADLYLRPAGSAAADQHPTMSADIADGIERIPGVAAVDRFRAYSITYQGLPATLASGETSRVAAAASTHFLSGENRQAILSKLPTGDYAVVSEPFANKHNIKVGSSVALPLGGALRYFHVLGIYYDYSTERGYIILDRKTLLRYLPDRAISNLAVYLQPSVQSATVRRAIDELLAGRSVMIFSNASLRRAAIATFDRTFQITYALEVIAVLVAVMGVAGALLAMILDRRREFALLRFLGAARSQVRGIILAEAGLLGLLATGIGLVLGTALSLILIFVINKQSFGWTIQFHWPVTVLLVVLSGVFTATVLAGLYPARTALRLNPIEVIHEE